MKTETIKEDDIHIEYVEEGKYYSCHEIIHDLFFSCKTDNGIEGILKKGRAMIQAKKIFLEQYPEYK